MPQVLAAKTTKNTRAGIIHPHTHRKPFSGGIILLKRSTTQPLTKKRLKKHLVKKIQLYYNNNW